MNGHGKKTSTVAASVSPPISTAKSLMHNPVFISALLALATFVVFLPSARNDFVNYDDSDYVTANPHVQGGLTLPNLAWAFQTGHASNWHPLTWISHMLDCQLFGQQP